MTARPTLRALQTLLGLGPARRRAADRDHLIERRDGDELAFEDVARLLGLAQQVLRAAADDLDAVAQELLEHLLEGQRARPAIHQGQQDDADRLLQRRELVELVEHELRVGVALEVDDDADRLAVAGADSSRMSLTPLMRSSLTSSPIARRGGCASADRAPRG